MREINKLIVHCSATAEGKDYSLDTIRKWHLKRGWRDIGYHYVIQRDGTTEEGRPLEQIGAHVKGMNRNSIGICYIGGVEAEKKNGKWIAKDTRTDEQKQALEDLLCSLKIKFPSATVHGHNEFSSKSCPCFNAKEEYEWISNQF